MKLQRLVPFLILAAAAAHAAETPEQKLIAVLKSNASVFEKAKACQSLARIGTKQAVPCSASSRSRTRVRTPRYVMPLGSCRDAS